MPLDARPGTLTGKKPGKVPLTPGHSLFHWAKKSAALADLAKRRAPRVISLLELQSHSTLDDAWCAIAGRVYDVTPYLDYHPGGAVIFAQVLGDDATDAFAQYHQFVNARELCAALELGTLASSAGAPGSLLAKLTPLGKRAPVAAPPPAAGVDGWVRGLVSAAHPAGRDMVRLTVAGELPGADPSAWERGSHVMVALPTTLGPTGGARRPYTPFRGAETPPGHFELLVKHYSHGLVSRPLAALAKGGELLYRGALGGTKRPIAPETRKLVLLAAGTGITPMLQLLAPLCAAHAAASGPHAAAPLSAQLVCFNSSADDVPLAPELQALGKANKGWLRVSHSLGQQGRLSAAVLSKLLPTPGTHVQIFVCGPPFFNAAARTALEQLGHASGSVLHFFS
jgi:ferredoxin-NADP reductase